jgi:streptomycin 6-kinase
MLDIPDSLGWLRSSEDGRAWLGRLPGLVAECRERWDLWLGRPYPDAYTSLVLPAGRSEGPPAVLKIQFPDRESEREAEALVTWEGRGAVRLLEHDPERRALLIERCEPGTPLADRSDDEALGVMAGLLPRLWRPAGPPFRPLAEEAAHWAETLPASWERTGRPFERKLLDSTLEALGDLSISQNESVLLHQDLHAGNVLRAAREPWLVIDPKPLAGEREFGIAALVRGSELGSGWDRMRHRLEVLTSDLGLDRDRARRWALAQTIAWAFEGDRVLVAHVEAARCLLELR